MIGLAAAHDVELHGRKAVWLARLVDLGFTVPDGYVIATDELTAGVTAGLADQLRALPAGPWAVRSSSVAEDGAEASFAGQFDSLLDVATDGLPEAVARVLTSAHNARAAAYRPGSKATAAMAVIVQRQVLGHRAGVVFTVNPATGAEHEAVVESLVGDGSHAVDGLRTPQRQVVDTRGPEAEWPAAVQAAKRLQVLVGHPVDVEFVERDDELVLVQARPVTGLRPVVEGQWTTANFRDGGVSARACTPMMWSLYGRVWEVSLRDFLVGCHMVPASEWGPAGRMLYGRPYWNVGQVKRGMARIAGFDEAEFDAELGIPTAEHPVRTPVTLGSLVSTARIAGAQARRARRWRRMRDQRLRRFDQHWRLRMAELDSLGDSADDDEQAITSWLELVGGWHLPVQGSYFELIFINTVALAMTKQRLLAVVEPADWFALVSGLDEVSHLAPARALWQASRTVRARPAMEETERLALLAPIIERWGYHADHELDLTQPAWREDPSALMRQLSALAELGDEHHPAIEQSRVAARRSEARGRLLARAGAVRGRFLLRRVESMRRSMWWREEFRDLSTRWYHLTRRSTLRVGEALVRRGVLGQPEDVWFLTADDLTAHLDGGLTSGELRARADAGRAYFSSFEQFTPPMELGGTAARVTAGAGDGLAQGEGASPSVVVGRARVVTRPDELADLAEGDILVTRFTDTGWTAHFATLGGLVTEYGGTLCHAAVVAREYGIACVVAAEGATELIADGAIISVDGASGRVDLVAEPGSSSSPRE